MHHTRGHPFACRVCARPFRIRNNCTLHEKGQHKEEYKKFLKPIHRRTSEDFFPETNEKLESVDRDLEERRRKKKAMEVIEPVDFVVEDIEVEAVQEEPSYENL